MVIKKMPILKCFPTPNGQVKAWCPFCKKWHLHGHPKPAKSNENVGHRVAHCTDPDSPFHSMGYELRIITKAEIKNISKSLELIY